MLTCCVHSCGAGDWVRGRDRGTADPLPQAWEETALPVMARAAKLKWRLGWAIQMCVGILPHLYASSTHPEAFTWAIPESELLQNQESLKNTHCFLLKQNVLDIPLSKELAPLEILTLRVPL